MRSFAPKSLATKLLLVTGSTVAVLLLASNFFLISQTRERVQSLIGSQAESEAKSIATSIAGDVGALASAARTMAGVISHGHQIGTFDRKDVIDILKTNLEQQPSAFGSWFAEEPGMFDKRQAEAKGKLDLGGSKKSGAFNPYWTKGKDGKASFSTFDEDYAAEWYAVSAKTLKGSITKPYVAQDLSEKTAMSSISYPVISNGKLIGVAGADVSLSMLSKSLSSLTPFGTGRVLLVSHDGKWLVAPDAKQLNTAYDGAAPEKIKAALESGTISQVENLKNDKGESFSRLVYPFKLPDLNATWVLLVDVPDSALAGPVQDQTTMMVIAGIILLAAVLGGLWYATRKFVQKPIEALIVDVAKLGSGDYQSAVSGQQRQDETGCHAYGNLRRTAIGNQWQSHAFCRQKLQIDADIDDRLEADLQNQASHGKAREVVAVAEGVRKAAHDDEDVKADQRHAEEDAEFLGRHREYKVGMTVGQDALDDTLARSSAEPVAARDRVMRRIDLERVALAGQELVDAAGNVRKDNVGEEQQARCTAGHDDDPQPRHACHEEHRAPDGGGQHGLAEVRLGDQ